MGVRFLIGRAGTGKSAACAAEIRAEMARDPLGGALLWIAPEQATFTAERMLFSGDGATGSGAFRAQVMSFRRLAAQIGRAVGFLESERVQPLGDLARLVLLEEMVRRPAIREKLQVFGAVAERAGFVQKLDATLRELRQHEHSGDTLRALAVGKGTDPLLARKLEDLAVLAEGWAEVMGAEELWDLEKILHHAALRAGDASLIAGGSEAGPAQVWVDGFSAMSALEMRLLVALGQHSAQVTVTLLADADSPAIRELRCAPENMSLFARTERLYCQLHDVLGKYHVRVAGTHALRRRHRFTNADVGQVEAGLFEEGGAEEEQASAVEDAVPGVELWECSDPETEVRAVAQAIRALAVGAGDAGADAMRYRQIGLIVPDLDGYQDAIGRIFAEHHIPHFIDQRRSIAHHPLVEFLRSAVAIRASHWDQDDVLLYLKTGLAGVGEDDVAVIENYVIGHGITHVPWGAAWRWAAPNQKDDEDAEQALVPEHARLLLQRVNRVRDEVWRPLRAWVEARESDGNAAEFVMGLHQLLARLNVGGLMQAWITRAGATGNPELAQIHEQVWRQVQDLLAMLEGLLKDRARTLVEFARILEGALATLTLGLIPPTVDQVLISSVTRSRVPELRVCFLLGAIEGQFPKVAEEDPILSDAQRALFNEHADAAGAGPIGMGAERQLMEMPFFDYTALTRARERLIVSYPVADRRGRAVGRSRYIQRLKELLGARLLTRRFDAGSRTDIDRIGTMDDLLTGVVAWTRDALRRHETLQEAGADGLMARVYHWLAGVTDGPAAAARTLVWRCIEERPAPRLAEAMARRFYPPERDLRISVSQLEKFAACPLQYFMHYTLGLRPRAMLEMDTLHLGTLYHRILEKVYLKIMREEIPGGSWPDCSAQSLRAALEAEVDAASLELHAELAERMPAYDKMRARTKRVLGIVLEGQRRRACAGDMRPVGVEVIFGEHGSSAEKQEKSLVKLPVLRIATRAGHQVELNGKIDRVDASNDGEGRQVAVIDYKSAREKNLELHLVYWGLMLQLPVYAVVMEALAERQPIAAMYVPLGLKREKVAQWADAADADSDAFYQKQKPRGMVDADGAPHLDAIVGPMEDEGEASPWFSIGFTKRDRRIPKRGDMIAHEDFQTLLAFVRWKIAAMADDLMRGEIAPAPYRSKQEAPCDHCDFASLCPFDRVSGIYRDVPRMDRDTALQRMRADVEGRP